MKCFPWHTPLSSCGRLILRAEPVRCYGVATQFQVRQLAAVVEFTPEAYWLTDHTRPFVDPVERSAIHNEVADHGERARPPGPW